MTARERCLAAKRRYQAALAAVLRCQTYEPDGRCLEAERLMREAIRRGDARTCAALALLRRRGQRTDDDAMSRESHNA